MNKNIFIALILLVAVLPLLLVLTKMQQNIQKKATGYEYTIQVDPNSSFARIMYLINPAIVTTTSIVGQTDVEPVPTGVGETGNEWVGYTGPEEPTIYDPDPRVREDL